MPAELQAFITNGYNDGAQAAVYMLNARNHITQAGVYIGAEDFALAQTEMSNAADDMGYFVRYLLQDTVFYKGLRRDWKDALEWINDNWPNGEPAEPYELTLDKILDTIWNSDKLRWFHFINYIDSMRAGIWNVEIYDTHLAEWYRHFST